MKHNTLIEGTIATGKTTALRTIIEDTDKELFIIATEPGIETILGDLPEDRCHWKYIPPTDVDWDTMRSNANLVNSQTTDFLQKTPGANRHEYRQFIDLLDTCANFKDDRTGKEFGMVDHWGEDKVLAIDGLTGLNTIAQTLVVGPKIIMSWPEFHLAQQTLLVFVKKLCEDLKCNFVLTAHTSREKDEVTGGTHITVDTIGIKLAPQLIRPFDEILYAYKRDSKEFLWSNQEADVDLKNRVLPISSSLKPSFAQILNFEGEIK